MRPKIRDSSGASRHACLTSGSGPARRTTSRWSTGRPGGWRPTPRPDRMGAAPRRSSPRAEERRWPTRACGRPTGCRPRLPRRRVRHTFQRERQRRRAEQERPDGRDLIEEREPVRRQVVGDPAGHALEAESMLHEEGHVEPDEHEHEVQPRPSLVEASPEELREPEVDPRAEREDRAAEQHVVEVGYDEVAVVEVEVQGVTPAGPRTVRPARTCRGSPG